MRGSSRPKTVRTSKPSSKPSIKSFSKPKSKKSDDLWLPEDEDEVKPKGRKKRSREQTKESDAFVRDSLEVKEELEELLENSDSTTSRFKKDFASFTEDLRLDNPDFRIDKTSNAFHRSTYAMLMELIPIAEAAYRASKKESASYALIALTKQADEVQAALKLSDDLESRAAVIRGLIQTSFMGLANSLVNEKYDFHSSIDQLTSDARIRKGARHAMDDMVKKTAMAMDEFQKLLGAQVSMFLNGDPNYLNPFKESEEPKKKKKGRKKKE